jgi:hypothetical protein
VRGQKERRTVTRYTWTQHNRDNECSPPTHLGPDTGEMTSCSPPTHPITPCPNFGGPCLRSGKITDQEFWCRRRAWLLHNFQLSWFRTRGDARARQSETNRRQLLATSRHCCDSLALIAIEMPYVLVSTEVRNNLLCLQALLPNTCIHAHALRAPPPHRIDRYVIICDGASSCMSRDERQQPRCYCSAAVVV